MVPVVDSLRSRHLLGVVTDHDIVTRCVAGTHDVGGAIEDYMTTADLAFVDADDNATTVIRLMQARRLRRMPVVGGDGRLTGVVALADLATRMTPEEPDVLRAIELRVSGGHAVIAP
jgi:CBS domain-containing protein